MFLYFAKFHNYMNNTKYIILSLVSLVIFFYTGCNGCDNKAVKNIDAICSVEGLDMIFIGSGDLRLSLTGKASKAEDSKVFDEAVDVILKSCQEHGRIAGIWSPSVQEAQSMKQKGFRFIALKSDSMMLSEYAKQQFNELQKISKS